MEDNKETNLQEQYYNFLKEEIKTYCDENGEYEMNWDTQDIAVFSEELPSMIEEYNGEDNFIEFIENKVLESYMNSGWYVEDGLYDMIYNDAKNLSDKVLSEYITNEMSEGDFWFDMSSNGYSGVNVGVEAILSKMNLVVDIFIATPAEQNYDLGSIIPAFGSDYLSPELDMIDETYLDNGITLLLNQQGHKVMELYNDLYGENSSNKLIRSVAEEITNNPAEASCCLTAVSTVTGEQYAQLINMVNSGAGSIELPVGTSLGIFNDWIGGGSTFEIELEKPFVVPASCILKVKSDSDSSRGNYSVADVYGGDISNENAPIKVLSGSSEVQLEDLATALSEAANKYAEKED